MIAIAIMVVGMFGTLHVSGIPEWIKTAKEILFMMTIILQIHNRAQACGCECNCNGYEYGCGNVWQEKE